VARWGAGQRAGQSGQALVELALILPVLALILLGIVDFGRVFYTYGALANAAREGARYCALHPADTEGTRTRVRDELEARVSPVLAATVCANPPRGTPVTVAAAAIFDPVTPLVGGLIAGPVAAGDPCNRARPTQLCIVATATMVVW
jgi:hypothetical protein